MTAWSEFHLGGVTPNATETPSLGSADRRWGPIYSRMNVASGNKIREAFPTARAARAAAGLVNLNGVDVDACHLPPVWAQPADEAGKRDMVRRWLAANESARHAIGRAECEALARQGWPFEWLQSARTEDFAVGLLDAVEEALAVTERCYPAILDRGLDHAEDMGLLQCDGWAKSEGIRVKREPYGRLVLVSVCVLTGPSNFDAFTHSVEFEPGCRSWLLHLVYEGLPTGEQLQGDLAAYPVVTSERNRLTSAGLRGRWNSEGWIGRTECRPWLHRPWNSLSHTDTRTLLRECGQPERFSQAGSFAG